MICSHTDSGFRLQHLLLKYIVSWHQPAIVRRFWGMTRLGTCEDNSRQSFFNSHMFWVHVTTLAVEAHVLLASTSKLLANARGWPSLDLVNRIRNNYMCSYRF
eukprot:8409785-Karenia_brevis.AAC.1